MRRACIVLMAAFLGASATCALAQPLFTPTQDPASGARLFQDKHCVACHAIDGEGGTVGPDLARATHPRTFYDLAAGLWNHAPIMAARMRDLGIPRPSLTPQESADLAAYLFTVNYFDHPGNAVIGRRLFTSKRCVACHQLGGRGGTVGPALDHIKVNASPIAVAATMWNHGPAMAAEMDKRGIPRPTFRGTELRDLIAFVAQTSAMPLTGPLYVLPGRAPDGMRVLVEKRCLECHSTNGKGGGALNLAERGAHKSVTDFAAAMWNALPRMTSEMSARHVAFQPLKPDEMADVVASLYAVRYFAEAGDARSGVILATYKGCLACHGLFGEHGKPASDLTRSAAIATPPGALAAMWNHAFVTDPRPADRQAAAPTFTGKEMADLIAYLQSLKRGP